MTVSLLPKNITSSIGMMLSEQAGDAGIAIGKLTAFFNTTDWEQILESLHFLPLVALVLELWASARKERPVSLVSSWVPQTQK